MLPEEGFDEPPLFREHGPVVQVLEVLALEDDGFAVVLEFLAQLVALQVQHAEVRQQREHLINDGLVGDLVVLEIETRKVFDLEKSLQIADTGVSCNSIWGKVNVRRVS